MQNLILRDKQSNNIIMSISEDDAAGLDLIFGTYDVYEIKQLVADGFCRFKVEFVEDFTKQGVIN